MRTSSVVEFEEAAYATKWLQENLSERDAVLIKGSHGLRMDRIIAAVEVHS